MNNFKDTIPGGFKMTELGLLPEEWEVVRLGEVAEILDSKRVPLSEDIRKKKDEAITLIVELMEL